MKLFNFEFHPKVILRAPRNTIATQFDIDFLETFFSNHLEKEALFLASPALFEVLEKWFSGNKFDNKSKTKLFNSLAKYYLRAANRATPFGLFAGIATLDWADETNIKVADFERNTRLDISLLCEISNKIKSENSIRKKLKYYLNSSLYKLNNEYRYVEIYFEKGNRAHKITSIKSNLFIAKIVKFVGRKGAFYNDILALLLANEINEVEASTFLDELINVQLLNSEIEPNISGIHFANQLEKSLAETVNYNNIWLETLQNINAKLVEIDASKENKIEKYNEVIELINSFSLDVKLNNVFQVDMTFKLTDGASLNSYFKRKMSDYLEFLLSYQLAAVDNNLDQFKDKFYGRFQDQEIPLSFALDTENGIGYLNKINGDFNPIIENILFHQNKKITPERSKNKQLIFEKLVESIDQGCELKLEKIEFQPSPQSSKILPLSFNILFRLLENNTLFIESICGSNAATLLGRFANYSGEINEMLRSIFEQESNNNKEVIFAEIIHLPENRAGNVIMHPSFRRYEIPYLAKASVEKEFQIPIDDLVIKIVDNELILKSKRLNKIIIPRLSNAHNYIDDALPVYQFLCDFQHQNSYPFINLDIDTIGYGLKFIPRITFKNAIVNLATWNFKKSDFKEVIDVPTFTIFKEKNKLPMVFIFAENDNELVIDCSNKLSVDLLIHQFKKSDDIQLKEYLNYSNDIQDINGNTKANQLVATGFTQRKFNTINHKNKIISRVKRNFEFGSEWLYIKLYCGANTADLILEENIKTIANKCHKSKLIDSWFFIRYNDHEPHLRVRFHLTDNQYFAKTIEIINLELKPLISNNIIWKMQAETYERELERYGFEQIELHEKMFYFSSEAYLGFCNITDGDERELFRLTFAMQLIDCTFDLVGYNLSQKSKIIKALAASFHKEFNLEKTERLKIDEKYRNYKELILSEMDINKSVFSGVLKQFRKNTISIINQLLTQDSLVLETQIISQIHMHVNRIISSFQREHELIIYDFLARYYTTELKKTNLFQLTSI